MTWTENSVK